MWWQDTKQEERFGFAKCIRPPQAHFGLLINGLGCGSREEGGRGGFESVIFLFHQWDPWPAGKKFGNGGVCV